jgi:ribokinase
MISTRADVGVNRTVILVDPAGERSVIVFPADRPSLPDETWQSALARLRPNLCYFASWDAVAKELAPTVKAAGGLVATTLESTALETSSPEHVRLPSVDILFLSREAATLLGWSTSSPAAVPAGWRQGPPVVVVTLGSAGAWYHMPLEGQSTYAPVYHINPKDTTGAGDSFAAAFCFYWLHGERNEALLARANASGALAALALGPRSGLPTRHAIEDMVANQ